MSSQLKYAYDLGVLRAREVFEKQSAEDILTSALGALPLIGPPLAGYAASRNTPFEPKEVAARTGAKSGLGQALGAVGGGALGAGLGAGGAALYNKLRDKGLWDSLTGSGDLNIGRSAGLGAGLGALLGGGAGGAYGAQKGKEEATNVAAGERFEDLMENRQEEIAKQMRNQRILRALTQAYQMGGYGMPLRIHVPPQLAAALQQRGQG